MYLVERQWNGRQNEIVVTAAQYETGYGLADMLAAMTCDQDRA